MSNKSKKIKVTVEGIAKDIFELIDDFYLEHCLNSAVGLPLTNATLDMLDNRVKEYRLSIMYHAKSFFGDDFSKVLIRWIDGGMGYQQKADNINRYLDYLQKLNMIDQTIYNYHVQLIQMRNR